MNVTVGKYIPGNSFVHRLDPRLKLATNILFIILIFTTKSFIMEAILFAPVLISYIASGISKRKLIKVFIPVMVIGTFLFLINTFIIKDNNHPELHIYTSWFKLIISDIAIQRTLLIMVRIYIVILVTTLLTATTKPMDLTRGIEDLLTPLKLLFIPVNIIAMIISIALRFIPTLLEEAQRIMKAQASRGVDFKNGNIKSKSKSMITLIIPLFVSAFAKAEDLGNAMETRGYDPYEKRTKYRVYPFKFLDLINIVLMCAMIALVVLQKQSILGLPTWIK